MNQRWNYAVRSIVCIALAAAMVGVSELLGEKEIIFPEITALTVGAIAAPKHSWKVSRAYDTPYRGMFCYRNTDSKVQPISQSGRINSGFCSVSGDLSDVRN